MACVVALFLSLAAAQGGVSDQPGGNTSERPTSTSSLGCPACRTSHKESTLVVPKRACEPGNARASQLLLHARALDGSAVGAGGDVFTAWIDDRGGDPDPIAAGDAHHVPVLQWALEVSDQCDGEYLIELPCTDLRFEQRRRAAESMDPPRFRVSVYLTQSLNRRTIPASQWWCPKHAHNFSAWDTLDAKTLTQTIYRCSRRAQPAAGTPIALHLDDRVDPVHHPSTAGECSKPRPLTRRDKESSSRLFEPWLWPCARGRPYEPSARAMEAMGFDYGPSFEHCVGEAGRPECPVLPYASEPPACLAGKLITLIGDSVTRATTLDMARFWGLWHDHDFVHVENARGNMTGCRFIDGRVYVQHAA